MQETTAPKGYQKSDTVYKVVIEDRNDATKESRITYLDGTPLTVISNPEGGYGTVTFNKKNTKNQMLSGAEFTLYTQWRMIRTRQDILCATAATAPALRL